MMRVLTILLLAASCSAAPEYQLEKELLPLMEKQEKAWSKGDIGGFMAFYHPEVCFLGNSGLSCGLEKVTANYEKSYPDKEAMGVLAFQNNEYLPVSDQNAWVTGTWKLFRKKDTLSGKYSLLWERTAAGWLILRDHSDINCK